MLDGKLTRRDLLQLGTFTAVGIALAACAPEPSAEPEEVTEPAVAEPEAEDTEPSGPADTPAPDVVEVTWHNSPHAADDVEKVEDALGTMLQEKGVNARINFVNYADLGELGEKMNLKFAAGEVVDIVWVSSWANDFYNNARNGNLLALDDLLPEHAPELWSEFSEKVWNVGRVGGELYGIPNQQIWVKTWGPFIRKDILEKYPIDWDEINDIRDMEPYMDEVMENEDFYSFFDQSTILILAYFSNYEEVGGAPGVGVLSDDPERKAAHIAAQPVYLEAAKLQREWVEKEYLAGKLPAEDVAAMWKQEAFAGACHVWKPEWYDVPISIKDDHVFEGKHGGLIKQAFLRTSGINATMNAIGASSPHPEAALQILNLVNTDPEVFNTVVHGIEGTHWKWVDEEKDLIEYPEGVDGTSTPYKFRNWAMGDTFNGYYFHETLAENDAWAMTRELNEEAEESVILGFVFNPEPVKTEVAQVSSVQTEFGEPLGNGDIADVEAGVEELVQKQKDAGIEKVIEEVQKQIDDWAATLE